VIVWDIWNVDLEVSCMLGSSAFDFVMQGIPASVKVHWMPYQKHLSRLSAPPVVYNSCSYFCAVVHIVCINIANKRPRCNAHSVVSSTKASP
jgi:hypothetical protein